MPSVSGLIAPGSTRSNLDLERNCDRNPPLHSAACESGLDNSPLYQHASFIWETDTIDQLDVGLSSLWIRDLQAIAKLASAAGEIELAHHFDNQAVFYSNQLNQVLWNEDAGIYLNKKWTTNEWIDKDDKTGAYVVTPTSFYPMLCRIPDDTKVSKMLDRYLTNSSEFAVNKNFSYGVPSVSRSSSHFQDNSYWRGRVWGPMNFLLYLGLHEYKYHPEVHQVMVDLARQSKATFLVEWKPNRRVMENYNSMTAEGCDVHSSNPFYHWGGLLPLVAMVQSDDEGKFWQEPRWNSRHSLELETASNKERQTKTN